MAVMPVVEVSWDSATVTLLALLAVVPTSELDDELWRRETEDNTNGAAKTDIKGRNPGFVQNLDIHLKARPNGESYIRLEKYMCSLNRG